MIDKEELAEILKAAGCKSTSTRLLILEVFSKASRPISVEFLLSKVKGVDTATVYRNIISLQKVGVIRKIDFRNNTDHYELSTTHHHHIICKACGIFEDFNACQIDTIRKNTLRNSRKFISITDHSLDFYGMCKRCGA